MHQMIGDKSIMSCRYCDKKLQVNSLICKSPQLSEVDLNIILLSERLEGELCLADECEYEAMTKPISKVVSVH